MSDDAESLRAIVLLGTLKHEGEFSHTETLCELLIEEFKKHAVRTEMIWLSDAEILPGVETEMFPNDDWPDILKKILASEILVFATPIWWGIESSLIRRIIERMDALNDELLETGKSELANKAGGLVITGAEDGAEHIIGNLSEFMVWNGLTMPPACSVSYLGQYPGTKEKLLERFRKQKSTMSMVKLMAHNLAFYARLLKKNPLPQKGEPISQSIAPGSPGFQGDAA